MDERRFYGYKHWTLETIPRCFYVGKGRKVRPTQRSRNHKWHAIVKRYGLRVEVCTGPVTNDEACAWEIAEILREETFSESHSHDDPKDIGCNLTRGGGGVVGVRSRLGKQHTPEARAKISQAARQRRPSPETRTLVSQALKGRSKSQETRARMQRAQRKTTPEIAQRIREMLTTHTCREIAETLGVSGNLVYAVKNGTHWSCRD